MTLLTTIILSKTPEINKLLLESVNFTDKIIVLIDSKEGALKTEGKIIYLYHPLNADFSAHRNFALKYAKSDWALFVDEDEVVSTELAREIQIALNNPSAQGYQIRRIDLCFHQPLLHGETGNSHLLRLGKVSEGKFVRKVHEFWKIKGSIDKLESPLYHLKNHFISEFLPRVEMYGAIDAEALETENKPFSYFRLLVNPKAKFLLNFVLKFGFLDGYAGLFQAYLMSVQSLSVRVFQWQIKTLPSNS